jgi:myo-inositol-1-phosphate synthase
VISAVRREVADDYCHPFQWLLLLPGKEKTTMLTKTLRKEGLMSKINVAIIGVGNCASSLIQGVEFYKNAKETDFVPGLMHVNLGGYHVRDIQFVAAFDIDKNKVGKDLSKAIFTYPNNTYKFADVPNLGVKVHRGMTHDGLGKYLSEIIKKAPGSTDDIVGILKETKTDVVIN